MHFVHLKSLDNSKKYRFFSFLLVAKKPPNYIDLYELLVNPKKYDVPFLLNNIN